MRKSIKSASKLAGFAVLCIATSSVSAQPVVSFSSPDDGDSIDSSDLLNVTVVATDADGSVDNVRLFVDGDFVRQENVSAYEWGAADSVLQNLEVGKHQLTAIATDDAGNSTEETISIIVAEGVPSFVAQPSVDAQNSLPVVSFSSPGDGDSINAGSSLNVTVDATDSDGSVENVRLFINRNLVRQENKSPYEWGQSDSIMQNLEAGTYQLTAIATDDAGDTTEETIIITVSETASAPTIPGPNANTFVGGGGTIAGAPSHSCNTQSGFTVVNSIGAMIGAMRQSNVRIALAPGTYNLNESDASLFTDQTLPGGGGGSTLLSVDGNNSRYDFRCTKLNIDTDLWREFGKDEVIQLRTVGNNNVISNLTIEDIGETSPSGGALNVMMDGRDNVLEGSVITARGSQPYGLGDAYGKGGGPVLSHQKHSTILIRGLRNTLRNSTVFNFAYGHSVFMQASDDTLIDGVYVQGELRSTEDMRNADNPRFALADARAASVNFFTVWGYQLPRGYWMSLQEAGIRAYNAGRTVIDGKEYQRGANDVTVLNSVVRNTRTGVTLVHATGKKYVENTTVLGVEQGYSIGSGDIVDSYGDADVGPVLSFAYSSNRGTTADITILPTDGARNGWGALAFIGGSDHNITLRSSAGSVNQNLPIVVSGDKHSIRHLNGALANQDNLTVRNTVINNLTNFPLVINNLAEGTEGQSNGLISGNIQENSVRQN